VCLKACWVPRALCVSRRCVDRVPGPKGTTMSWFTMSLCAQKPDRGPVDLTRAEFGPRHSHCAVVAAFSRCLAGLSVAEICALVNPHRHPFRRSGGRWQGCCLHGVMPCDLFVSVRKVLECLELCTLAVTECASGRSRSVACGWGSAAACTELPLPVGAFMPCSACVMCLICGGVHAMQCMCDVPHL
jgi:hypothetical protein